MILKLEALTLRRLPGPSARLTMLGSTEKPINRPEVRQIMVSKDFSVAVMVSDGKKSAKWYKEVLGFETSEEGHWVTAWPKGAPWKLHLCEGKLEPGNTGIGFYAEDLKVEVDNLKKKGAKFAQDYTKTEWGEVAKVEDPDGNIIWISKGSP